MGSCWLKAGWLLKGIGPARFFRVISVPEKQHIYTWEGQNEFPHGQLNLFPGLGFSSDGSILQTFTPEDFDINRTSKHLGFKFWSTTTWELLDRNSRTVEDSLLPGERMFALSEDGAIRVYSKINGDELAVIVDDSCRFERPCEVIFSPDGTKMAVLHQTDRLPYKRESLITDVAVYNFGESTPSRQIEAVIRNKHGIQLTNTGELKYWDAGSDPSSTWWTNSAYFSGFNRISDEIFAFYPQIADIFTDQNQYFGTCLIDTSTQQINCQDGLSFSGDVYLTIEHLGGSFLINGNGEAIAQVQYPPGSEMDDWQIRIKAYHPETGTGYFCLDRNLREETCVIMNFIENTIIAEQVDLLVLLQPNRKGMVGFVNRERKALILFNEFTGTTQEMRSNNAIAFPVKPALLDGSDELLYFVKGLENQKIYIERISMPEAKVVRRYNFEGFEEVIPTAISSVSGNELWAVGSNDGEIYFLDPETGEIIFQISASAFGIVDLLFTPDGRQLYVMDEQGVVTMWMVEE